MSVNFSTITPMNQTTISRPPAFSTAASATAEQPAASSPTHDGVHHHKKSHWFRNTLITLVVLAAATGLGRKYLPNTFDPAAKLAGGENFFKQGLHYAKLGVAKAGEFVNKYVGEAYKFVASKFTKPTGTTTP